MLTKQRASNDEFFPKPICAVIKERSEKHADTPRLYFVLLKEQEKQLIGRYLTFSQRGAETKSRWGHYSPNTKRPNWSPNCLTCSGSLAARNRSANWKNVFSFCR